MPEKKSALFVQPGVKAIHDGMQPTKRRKFTKKRQPINIEELSNEVKSGSKRFLAKAITLLESANLADKKEGQALLKELLPYTGKSIRIGITGVPGAGKSTFIETFGKKLIDEGHKVAVLAIDPSSSITGGSILGDKTRMELLSREPQAFIRPSPAAGTLGGVHKKTRETMLLCEAAGYDIILVETVGVGQSETIVRGMVDFFLLLVLTGAGDELQGMKKGIMELADMIVVHKADGDNIRNAKKTVAEYRQFLHLLQPSTPQWTSKSMAASSYDNKGLDKIWTTIEQFRTQGLENHVWENRRKEQTSDWFRSMITDHLIDSFYGDPQRKKQVNELEQSILSGEVTVSQGVETLFDTK
ncbi:methylmalonyl Co-A mutase-associated GTPase MeaB [Kurthia sibirica]|uniref:Methylmalonyl Co-A mutase-associated GTPase MeaB n=1 Tax=Kurthia sibirica TaxID=202750 RepID=A0A2U3ALU2_9BACL|nr:methylmalonyl Co-A mutase-associated GTPase MeaB [Kurthia sibirica]PWI25489.1 methylmalonyl Co-A mutase-associated GTPase MeaB [Kurthia sibirica]GEK33966.1 ATPase/protein kinase [Kurthia sibirica]